MNPLQVLPVRTAGAAENMAVDFLLLRRFPQAGIPRFRHYSWRGPAFTFGFSQKIADVRAQLPEGTFDLCRRPTGGGLVDHRDDWTYALVVPRGHPLEEMRAVQSYRIVHEGLAEALRAQRVAVELELCGSGESAPGVCFRKAELFDVVRTGTGTKVAGAAQKRTKQGLLFQGSIARSAAGGEAVDWERFQDDFTARLGVALGAGAQVAAWPEMDEDEVGGLVELYASAEWVEVR